MKKTRIISYGGGIQSTAMCVLATQGKLGDVTAAVMANVGDDSEHQGTIKFVRTVMTPWAAERGLPIVEVQPSAWPNGDPKTLLSYVRAYNGCQSCGVTFEDECLPSCQSTRNTGGGLPLPMKILPSMAPVQRSCTKHWKILPIRQWLLDSGASAENPADVLIGISTDEWQRASDKPRHPAERAVYPLLNIGLSRNDCVNIIREAGLPTPPKSACWFCPFQPEREWARRRVEQPDIYEAGVELEEYLNTQRKNRGLAPVQFLRNKPLREVKDPEPSLFDGEFNDGECDEGYCWV